MVTMRICDPLFLTHEMAVLYVLTGAENLGGYVQFRMKQKLKDLENCIKAIVNLTKTFTSLISWV